MSKQINIRGVYKNGVAVNRGLYCSKNCEMVKNLFFESEIRLLISRFYTEVGSKCLKGNVVVHLNKSGSTHDMARNITVEVHLTDLYLYADLFAYFFKE